MAPALRDITSAEGPVCHRPMRVQPYQRSARAQAGIAVPAIIVLARRMRATQSQRLARVPLGIMAAGPTASRTDKAFEVVRDDGNRSDARRSASMMARRREGKDRKFILLSAKLRRLV